MYARTLFGLILLGPMLADAAEPDGQSAADDAAGESSANVTLRVRVVEASLTKLKNLGLSWPGMFDGDASEVDRHLTLALHKRLAKIVTDETIVVAVGSEARVHAGTEFTADAPSKADPGDDEIAFHGTHIVLAPRFQADGRLAIKLLCKQSRPIVLVNEPAQRRVHEIATVVELAEGEAIVLKGEKDKRAESVARGAFPHVSAALGRVTTTFNEIQTFVVVSRGPQLVDEGPAVVEMEE
ncbi:MAG TPA: hypothetical protein VG826_22810 [Pirellulales bacterium]|nr:hypothetical protein [Pirellulales bacterium]